MGAEAALSLWVDSTGRDLAQFALNAALIGGRSHSGRRKVSLNYYPSSRVDGTRELSWR